MGFIQKAFLRANNKKILDKLKELGYHICPCCYFDRAVWLDICIPTQSIHGVGYPDECYNLSLEDELKRFLSEREENDIDCGENENLFYFIAALRDDTDDRQVFTNNKGDWGIYHDNELEGGLSGIDFLYLPKDNDTDNYHKASVEELKLLFKK